MFVCARQRASSSSQINSVRLDDSEDPLSPALSPRAGREGKRRKGGLGDGVRGWTLRVVTDASARRPYLFVSPLARREGERRKGGLVDGVSCWTLRVVTDASARRPYLFGRRDLFGVACVNRGCSLIKHGARLSLALISEGVIREG